MIIQSNDPKCLVPGVKITCPNPACGAVIAETATALLPGETIRPENFKMLQDGHGDGKPMACTKCRTAFARFVIHTENGWR